MKLAYLTAGAAGMYCGSCMHDNTLASSLGRQGVETLLIPTYTPIRTDEQDVSIDQVFFGGINIYLQQKVPLFRHLPAFLDRFLDSPRLIRRVTRKATTMDPQELGALTVSMLDGARGRQKKEVRRLCRWLADELRPDAILLTNILIGGGIPEIRQRLKVPIAVTLQGDDIFLESLPEPYRSRARERIAALVPQVDRFLTHSRFYADFMADYLTIPRERIDVVPLGLDVRDFAPRNPRSRLGAAPTIGYLARLAPEKGLGQLVDAFIAMADRPGNESVRLEIAGWLGPTQERYAAEQFAKLDTAGLNGRWRHVGSPDRRGKLEFLESIDLLCVPTTYREPKGLFALEALAAGVPVVLPNHGAFPEMLAETGGGELVPPLEPLALADRLTELLAARDRLAQLGAAGRERVLRLRDADTMARRTAEWLETLTQGRVREANGPTS